nr:hypothetical protein [Tanacetum cinerariifolium]
MRIDELHKFSDGTLNDVCNVLDDRLKGIRMQYLPATIWRKGDKDRATEMIQAIKKMLKTRRIMRSLEKFVGGRLGVEMIYEMNFVRYVIQEIHALMILIPHTRLTRVNHANRPIVYYDDDDEDYTIAITPDFLITHSLSMGDEHLSTIPEIKSDELIKSGVENLVPNLSESEDLSNIGSECNVPVGDDFTTFSNSHFDAIDNDFTSSDDESFFEEDIPIKNFKIFSNPLFDLDEEIISTEIDSLLEEFSGELAHIDLISPRINEADFDPEEEIRLVEKLLYDNSSPRPPKEFNSENSDAIIECFSPSSILVKDSDSLMEEIDLFLTSDDSMPPGIENDDYDSEGDIFFFEELLSNASLPKNE